jgi:GNAT superfamily N-acetyltransferase
VTAIVVDRYQASDSSEALALDAACAQGRGLRLSFRRPTFHRRAESYPEHEIVVARLENALVGTLAVAVKPACVSGRACRAAFAFDLRVHPRARGCGVGTRLARAGLAWAAANADVAYAYTAAGNLAGERVCRLMGMLPAGSYAYLVCPTAAFAPPARAATPVGYREVHAAYVEAAGPFDFYADPAFGNADEAYVGSWELRTSDGSAGVSAFSPRTILAEVVEQLPLALRALRAAAKAGMPWPSRWPRIPEDGEELRSWYLFDAYASSGAAADDLLRSVAREARSRGVEWCHLVHAPGTRWVESIRADLPRAFAPLLSYQLLLRRFDAAPVAPIRRLHVDVRDL